MWWIVYNQKNTLLSVYFIESQVERVMQLIAKKITPCLIVQARTKAIYKTIGISSNHTNKHNYNAFSLIVWFCWKSFYWDALLRSRSFQYTIHFNQSQCFNYRNYTTRINRKGFLYSLDFLCISYDSDLWTYLYIKNRGNI